MKTDSSLDALKHHNPFASSSVGDPWDNVSPDVASIYHSEFEQICHLIRQKQGNPKECLACLVTGEAGSGKTHLITRILNHCKTDPGCSFAYIQPIENPLYPYNYLIREIINNLCKPVNGGSIYNHLDRLIGVLFSRLLPHSSKATAKVKKVVEVLNQDPLNVFNKDIYKYLIKQQIKKIGIRLLNEFDSQFDEEFLEVLFAYRIREKKQLAIKWLKNVFLDKNEREVLGKGLSSNLSEEGLEHKSKRILRSLGLLFQYTDHTMVLCFDRLENLEQERQVVTFGKCLEYFVDVAHSFLPLVFYRGETWEQQIRTSLNQHVVTRLETNHFDLQGCDETQSLAIIKSRLAVSLQNKSASEFGPLNIGELQERFSDRTALPREVINETNVILRNAIYGNKQLKSPDPDGLISNFYDEALSNIADSFDEINPEGEKLIRALELYICHNDRIGELHFEKLEYKKANLGGLSTGKWKQKELLIQVSSGDKNPFKVLFIVDNAEVYQTVSSAAKRGIKFLETDTTAKAVYIRDERCTFPPYPKWKTTHESIERFSQLGGWFFRLDKTSAVGWYALAELDHQIGSRELTCQNSSGQAVEINKDQLRKFIKTRLHNEKYPWFFQLDTYLQLERCEFKSKPKKSAKKASPNSESKSGKSDSLQKKSKTGKKETKTGSHDSLAQKLVTALASQGLTVDIAETIISHRFTRFKIKPVMSKGTTVRKIKNQSENLQVELGLESKPLIQPQAGYVSIDLPRKSFKPLQLKAIAKTRKAIQDDPKLTFPLGMSIDNEPFWADFSDPNMSSILVGGTSGSGKSVFLKSIVIGLAMRYKPNALQIVLVDPKRVSFTDLSDMPHLDEPIIMDNKQALSSLNNLVNKMEDRYKQFEQAKVADIVEYSLKHPKLPRYVIIIDEYADLMMDKNSNKALENAVLRIGQKGRAAGIHLVLSTQRPDSKTITPLIKANLQLKVALKVTTLSNSKIILDQGGAECLLGRGDMLVGGSISVQRLQGPMVGRKVRFV